MIFDVGCKLTPSLSFSWRRRSAVLPSLHIKARVWLVADWIAWCWPAVRMSSRGVRVKVCGGMRRNASGPARWGCVIECGLHAAQGPGQGLGEVIDAQRAARVGQRGEHDQRVRVVVGVVFVGVVLACAPIGRAMLNW